MLKFSSSVLSGKTPIDDGYSPVTLTFKCQDLSFQYHLVADSTVETPVAEDTQLYLSHVQPAAVFWSVVKLQALGDTPRFGWLERIIQRTELVSVEIVEHQPYRLCARVCLVNQPPHLMSEVHGSATLGHLDMPPATFGFTEHEQVAGAVSLVLVVISLHPSRPCPYSGPFISHQLLGCLIETDHGMIGVVVLLVQVQQSSIRATNSPLTAGIHHSFFLQGWSSFF